MIKNIDKFISKGAIAMPTRGILVESDAIVATDTFKLIKIKMDTGIAESAVVYLPLQLKTFDNIKQLEDGSFVVTKDDATYSCETLKEDYPDYRRAMEHNLKGDVKATIRVNTKQLLDIAQAFKGEPCVDIYLRQSNQPVEFKNRSESMHAVLMPSNL